MSDVSPHSNDANMVERGEVKKVIIHCSDSPWGSAKEIDGWHRARGFTMIGYHFVILNGEDFDEDGLPFFNSNKDGLIERGRSLRYAGAHCKGHNKNSIGICLIGRHRFTGKQLYESLPRLLSGLLNYYNLAPSDCYGHYEFTNEKTCPNIDMELIREQVILRNHKIIRMERDDEFISGLIDVGGIVKRSSRLFSNETNFMGGVT